MEGSLLGAVTRDVLARPSKYALRKNTDKTSCRILIGKHSAKEKARYTAANLAILQKWPLAYT